MFRVHLILNRLTNRSFFFSIPVLCIFPLFVYLSLHHHVTLAVYVDRCYPVCNGTSLGTSWHTTSLSSGEYGGFWTVLTMLLKPERKSTKLIRINGTMEDNIMSLRESLPSSSAPAGPWAHSVYSSLTYISDIFHPRNSRSTLTRHTPQQPLPQIQSVALPSSFGVKFYKCAQVKLETNPPQLTFFLMIHNMGAAGGTNLSQVAIRDSISGIVLIKTDGRVVERGYQTFAIDSLLAGSQIVVNYTAHIQNHKSEILDLPAFLTFSNASQNDVSMFGPLTTNLTLRVNSTDKIYPNHEVHFAGFVAAFFVILVLMLLGFLVMNLRGFRTRLSILQHKRRKVDSDPEYADCSASETVKDEATFEDKMVDVMVLEDPQNMYQALENLEMSSLLHATANLEAVRIQIYKDVMSCLLSGLRSEGVASPQAQQRLLSVLHGQLLGMEGRLKEDRGARMAALAGQCNLETREEMEAEHCREAAEKTQAELLCQHADQQEFLRCSVLLEKLHKLRQSGLQRALLVRHEEASAKVQRQIIEWRRIELHKIFSEELEEAVKMGELEKSAAKSVQHEYFTCQDQLEEVLDVVLANQRFVLAERGAQRKFLVHSLHSLNDLISDTFSSSSNNLAGWFTNIRRGSIVPAEQIDQLQEKTQKDLVMVRQRLDEALNQERRAMRCGLIKKRRDLISEMVRVQKQRQRDLSGRSRDMEEETDIFQHLHCWQNLLIAHSLELAELINNLDEEAAADIRKMTMRVIQGAIVELKGIQPSAAQAVISLLPAGTKHPLLQVEPEAGLGQTSGPGTSSLLQGQERLHQEGKAALRTLSCTREALHEAMEKELLEQKQLREQCRDFFRCLCLSQLTLSEDDRLRMKLEFQKCLSVIDRCLVLPHAVSRMKIHSALAAQRTESEEQRTNVQSEGKTAEARRKADTSDLQLFQKRLEDRIKLFEKEKEMESGVMNKVLEEIQKENQDNLLSQADSLAMQMATIHYHKAERRGKVLETSRAMLTLQNLLMQQLRERKNLEKQELAQSIQKHCLGLEEGEQRLCKERTEFDTSQVENVSNLIHRAVSGGDEDVFHLETERRMTSILQEALNKCEQVIALTMESFQMMTANNQAKEDLVEQINLKRLYEKCDQDLEFASQLVKQSGVSRDVLLEALRLLLPTLPESELLSVIDALCPKQHPASAEQENSGCIGEQSMALVVKLREDVMHKNQLNIPSAAVETERLQEKRQSLVEKLLPRSPLLFLRDAAPLIVEEKGKLDTLTKPQQLSSKSCLPTKPQQSDRIDGPAEDDTTSTSRAPDAERLFVFRDPPESCHAVDRPKRKKKRNFLNFKKSSVVPLTQP